MHGEYGAQRPGGGYRGGDVLVGYTHRWMAGMDTRVGPNAFVGFEGGYNAFFALAHGGNPNAQWPHAGMRFTLHR